MAALPYMQFFVSDYLADTGHLTGIEHGAYLLLLMNYWQTGKPLPLNNERLAKLSRVTRKQFEKIKPVIAEFFIEKNNQWYHKRIEADLSLVEQKSNKARASAMKGAELRISERSANAQRMVSDDEESNEANAQRTQCHIEAQAQAQAQAQTKEIQKKIDVANAPPVRAEVLEVFNFWKEKFNHPRQSLNDSYKKIISLALKNLTLSDCLDAIEGCSLTPHNIGQNDTGQKWDGLHIIFDFKKGNPARFIKNKHDPPPLKILGVGKHGQITMQAADRVIEKIFGEKNNDEK